MFCGRVSNNRINHSYEIAIRVAYSDDQSSFKHLLKKDCSVSVHHRNIRSFGIEIYKVKNNILTPKMSELLEKRMTDFMHIAICKYCCIWFKVSGIFWKKTMEHCFV